MEANKRTINDIFNGNRVLEIPFFQRSYVWGEEQWERFISDMEHISEYNKPYFMGSVILKQQSTSSGASTGDRRTVIDGQQRLTTISIFFKVLSLKMNNPKLGDIFRNNYDRGEICLVHNRNDIDSFNKVLNLDKAELFKGEDSVSKAFNYFHNHVDHTRVDFKRILNNMLFVGIDLSNEEDEQQIFDTINSLGVVLTTSELLKNYFFTSKDIDRYEKNWRAVFEKDMECKNYWDEVITTGRFRRCLQDIFFYAFLQIRIQMPLSTVSSEDKLRYSRVESLFDSYKDYIQKYGVDKNNLITEIKEYAALFNASFDPLSVNSEMDGSFGLNRINVLIFGLSNTTLIPYVLYVERNVQDLADRNRIYAFLESYVMRRMVCGNTTKNYNQLFTDSFILNGLLSASDLEEYIERKADKINAMPSDQEVIAGFADSKLVNNQTAGIIYFIESAIRNSLHSTALLGFKKYSLEHIMPKKWENNWPKVQTPEEVTMRNSKLLTLGNLAIITGKLNTTISDGNWDVKRNGNGKRPGLIQYAAGLETLTKWLAESEWNEACIERRAGYLASNALAVWN